MVVLSAPEIDEVFRGIKINTSSKVRLTRDDLAEGAEEYIEAQLLESEDFAEYTASVIAASQVWASSRGLTVSKNARDIAKTLVFTIKNGVDANGNTDFSIMGYLDIPLEENGKKYGSVTVDIMVHINLGIETTAVYEFLEYMDIGYSMNCTFTFDFKINLNTVYGKSADDKTEGIVKIILGGYHRENCKLTDGYPDKLLKNINAAGADELYRNTDGDVLKDECPLCHPFTNYYNKVVYAVSDTNTVHLFTCTSADRLDSQHGNLVKKLPEGKSYTYCDVCHPQNAEMKTFQETMFDSLAYTDWGDVLKDVREELSKKASGLKSTKNVTLFNVPVYLTIAEFGIKGELEFSFDFKGSLNFRQTTHVLHECGIKKSGWSAPQIYNNREKNLIEKKIQLLGNIDIKCGIKVSVYASVAGFSKHVRVDIAAKLGIYCDIDGIYRYTYQNGEADELHAMYMEIGMYANLTFTAKILKWEINPSLIGGEKKIPFIAFGYNSVVYNDDMLTEYEKTGREIDVSSIQVKEFMVNGCYDLVSTLKTSGKQGKYSVDVVLKDENGNVHPYCYYENGKIVLKDNAPCDITVVVTYTVTNLSDMFSNSADYFMGGLKIVNTKYVLDPFTVTYHITNHMPGEWECVTEVGCTNDGLDKRVYLCDCTGEDGLPKIEYRVNPALGHNKKNIAEVPVTCTTEGHSAYVWCRRCETELTPHIVTPPLGHLYTDEFTCHDRTCLRSGCDHIEYATTDHVFSDYIDVPAGGCSLEGYKVRYCVDCRYIEDDLAEGVVRHPHDPYFAVERNATCTETGEYLLLCNNCDTVLLHQIPEPLGHLYSDYIVTNEGHYRECLRFACHHETEQVSHIYYHSCDETCNYCGYERSTEHTWSEKHFADSDNHWYECTVCSKKRDVESHEGGTATCTAKAECTVCGRAYGKLASHKFIKNPIEKYLYKAAACENAATYYKSCADCGVATDSTFIYGPMLGHIESEYCNGGSYHYKMCLRDGCSRRFNVGAHTGGVATCSERAVCTVCGHAYGSTADHSYVQLADAKYLKRSATCKNAAEYYLSCTICGEASSEFFTLGEPLPHTPSGKYNIDSTHHYLICSKCGESYGDELHLGGTATCIHKAKCTVCGKVYGNFTDHSYTEAPETKYLQTPATCTTAAVYYKSCAICGEKSDDTFTYGESLGHTNDGKYTADNTHHYLNCNRCGTVMFKEAHKGGTATCIDQAKCSVCGMGYGSFSFHVFTYSAEERFLCSPATCTDAATYYMSCVYCGEKSDDTFTYGESLGHTNDGKYATDNTHHCLNCNRCGTVMFKEAHKGGTATCIDQAKCSVCGISYGETLPHDFIDYVSYEYLKEPATCVTLAVYYKSCSVCGVASNDTFTAGTYEDHTPSGEYISDDTFHKRVCSACGNICEMDYHMGTGATCTARDECLICGSEFGEMLEHSYVYERESNAACIKKATCTEGGEYYYSCICGKPGDSKTFYVEPLGHDWDGKYTSISGGHHETCLRCGEFGEIMPHFGGEATCTEKALCEGCGARYGSVKSHEYTEKVTTSTYFKHGVTCTSPAYYCYSCICGKAGENVFPVGEALGHKWDEEYTSDSEKHYIRCLRSCGETKESGAHEMTGFKITTPTSCAAPGEEQNVCTVCFYTEKREIPVLPHTIVRDQVIVVGPYYKPEADTYYSRIHIVDKCTKCDYMVVIAESGDHDPQHMNSYEVILRVDPTCTETGLTAGVKCTAKNCSDPILREQKLIEALGHEYKDGKCIRCEAVEPTSAEHFTFKLSDDGTYYILTGAKSTMPADVTIPDMFGGLPVREIGESAFEGNNKLKSVVIPDSVETVSGGAFSNCKKLISVSIGKGVTTIKADAFAYSSNISSVYFNAVKMNDLVEIIDGMTWYYNIFDNINPVQMKVTIGKDATRIPCRLFYSLNVVELTFEDGSVCEEIGRSAFVGTNITSISLPDSIITVDDSAFGDCDNLTTVDLGNGIESIAEYAFNSCDNLTDIVIPDSVKTIGACAFYYCDKLSSVSIGKSVESIGDDAFYMCAKLSYVYFNAVNMDDLNENSEIFRRSGYSGNGITFTIGKDVERIPAHLASSKYLGYNDPPYIKTVSFENGSICTEIGEYAFCWNEHLTKVTIPSSVQTIGEYAFCLCPSLNSISLSNGVKTIGERAFESCSALTKVTIPNSVTVIGDYAFKYCESLKNITIPSNVKTLGAGVFYNCEYLTSVSIGSNVERIEYEAFYRCSSLKSISIPGNIKSIGEFAFYECRALSTVTLGNGIESIGSYAFEFCSSLKSISIPNSAKTIGTRAFRVCQALTSVTLGNGVETIGDHAFSGCSALKGITIPGSVTTIGNYAFYDCFDFVSLTLSNGLVSIGDYAFYWCNISEVTIPSSVTYIGTSAFDSFVKITRT